MKYILLLSLAFFFGPLYAQQDTPTEVMSKILCECIENATEAEWQSNPSEVMQSCERGAVLGGLISAIPTEDDSQENNNSTTPTTTEIGKKEMREAYELLEKNCGKYREYIKNTGADLEDENNIEAIAGDACSCLDDVNQGLQREAMYAAIRECIEGAITSAQLQDKLLDRKSVV